MGYCFFTVEKIKSIGTLVSKDNHNNRKVEVDNADPNLFNKNKVLAGNEVPFDEFFRQRIKSLPYYQDKSIRKGQVLAYEVVTTFSREDREHIDVEAWQEKNVEWLKKTFDKAPDGKSNIASIIYHADEPGNVHCHAIIVPIDERGHLNASAFTDGSRALSAMQTSYAKEMKQFGLQRGLQGSSARHRDIRKFYADLNRAINVPEVLPNEDARSYRSRVFDDIQTLQASAKRQRDTEYRKFRENLDKQRLMQKQALEKEWAVGKEKMKHELYEHRDMITGLETREAEIRRWLKNLETISDRPYDEVIADAKYGAYVRSALKKLERDDPQKAEEIRSILHSRSDRDQEQTL